MKGARSYFQWFRESRQSALLVIFGEDLAALLGLTIALLAVGLTALTGNSAYDATGSIVIGVLLMIIAVFIGIEIKNLLIGQGVEAATKKDMLNFLNDRSEVKRVFNLLTMQLGNDVMVAVKAEIADYPSAIEMIMAINTVEASFRKNYPDVLWLFFEPDLED